MGMLGRYIDSLPVHGRDRLIRAQEWCVAGVLGPDGGRCLVGYAEDWQRWEPGASWRGWMDEETGAPRAMADNLELLCSEEIFAFRRSHPADRASYRDRLERWGLHSECEIGGRFDRLVGRRGMTGAVRLVKARAAREFRPEPLLAGRERSTALPA